ncbi:MAG: hypothetical protein M3164_01985, partial [Actinomycetota bacterium]|nr:hypothetical protein [Actinomycetota bacterium]
SRIEGMKRFEQDFRSRLTAFMRSQLDLLEKAPMIGAEMPAAPEPQAERSLLWDISPPEPFLPDVGFGDLSGVAGASDLSGDLKHEASVPAPGVEGLRPDEGDARGSAPEPQYNPEAASSNASSGDEVESQDEQASSRSVSSRTSQPTQPVPIQTPPPEPRHKPEQKDENRSIRELFWGEE